MPSSTGLSITIPSSSSPTSTASVLPQMPQTSSEIERELSSVRSLRRRSGSASGSLGTFDPDLPPTKDDLDVATGLGMALPGTSRSPTRTSPGGGGSGRGLARGPSSPSGSKRSGQALARPPVDEEDEEADRDAQLFWVPAHLHPELAPSEFRAFLKEHAHAHAQEAEEEASESNMHPGTYSSSPSSSISAVHPASGSSPFASPVQRASSLSRKRSMLSRQYTPRANDGVESEKTPALPSRTLSHRSRNRTSIYSSPFATDEEPGVSLMDLQKLEELADEAAKSDDPSALRSLLKRSWSVNTGSSPNADAIDGVAMRDDYDSPVMPIKPGSPSLIRRGARTKIRKAGMDGDAPHRFGPSRRAKGPLVDEIPSLSAEDRPLGRTLSDEDHTSSSPRDDRPVSTASLDAAGIYDSYLNSRDSVISTSSLRDDVTRGPSESPSPPDLGMSISLPALKVDEPFEPFSLSASSSSSSHSHEEEPSSPPTPTQEQFKPSVYIPSSASETSLDRQSPPPSPEPRSTPVSPDLSNHAPAAHFTSSQQMYRTDSHGSAASSAGSTSSVKEKEKKKKGGLFSRKEKDDKKDKKPSGEKEKKGFSLFGSKKKQEEPASPVNVTDGRLAAASLLKAKGPASPGAPSPQTALGASTNFARYPIHVERAVYRLSHIKLANPRRPLFEQVLISNLMFWYLSIINKPDKGKEDEKEKEKKAKDEADEEKDKDKAKAAGLAMGKGTPPGHSTARDILNGSVVTPPATVRRPSNPRQEERVGSPHLPAPAPSTKNADASVRAPQYGAQAAQIDKEQRERGPPLPSQPGPPRGDSRPSPPPGAQRPPQPHGPPQQRPAPGQQDRPDARPSPPGYGGPGPNAPRTGPHAAGPPQQQSRPPNPPGYDLRLGQPVSPGGPRAPGSPASPRSPPPLQPGVGRPPTPQGQQQGMGRPPHAQSPPPLQQQAGRPINGPSPPPGQGVRPPNPQLHLSNAPPPRRSVSDSRSMEGQAGPPHPSGPPRPSTTPTPPPLRERAQSTSSPQPGQIFRPPPGSMPSGTRPGEVFNPNALPQIGQVFHHPGYRPAPYRPGGPPGGGAPPGHPQQGPPPGQQQRGPPPQGYYPQQGGPVQARPPFPGGSAPPGYAGPNPNMRPPPPGQQPYPQQQQQRPPPAGYYPPPPNGQQQRPLPQGHGPPPGHPNYQLAPGHHYPAPLQGQRRTSNQGEVVDPRVR